MLQLKMKKHYIKIRKISREHIYIYFIVNEEQDRRCLRQGMQLPLTYLKCKGLPALDDLCIFMLSIIMHYTVHGWDAFIECK